MILCFSDINIPKIKTSVQTATQSIFHPQEKSAKNFIDSEKTSDGVELQTSSSDSSGGDSRDFELSFVHSVKKSNSKVKKQPDCNVKRSSAPGTGKPGDLGDFPKNCSVNAGVDKNS